MGQQTQMERVVKYFSRWIDRFPDINAVATAPELEILKAWEGLGYYSRARNIHATAKRLRQFYDSRLPADYKTILSFPGIGPYTAAAIMSISFNQPFPVVDANVKRLYARLFDLDEPLDRAAGRKKLEQLGSDLLPREKARDFNQSVMELGALVCRPGTPRCGQCPVAGECLALERGTVDSRPVQREKTKKIEIIMSCGIIHRNGRIYIQQRQADDVWGGLWEFPGGQIETGESPAEAARREILEETELRIAGLKPLGTVVHHYTKYRVVLHGFTCRLHPNDQRPVLHAAQGYRWVLPTELRAYPFPAGNRQLIEKILRN